MSPSFAFALVLSHTLALSLIAAMVAFFVRVRAHRALAEGADSAGVFFASVQVLAYVPAATGIAIVALAGAPPEGRVMLFGSVFVGGYAPLLAFPFVMLPLAVAVIATTLVTHDVTVRTRGTDLTRADVLHQAAWVLILIGAAAAGVLGLQACFALGAPWAGVACVAAAIGVMAFARGRYVQALGLDLQAVTHGALRDRLFALAAKAGVALQQLYVVPMRRSRMANAFAVRGGVVLLTDWLLENLEPREVDAVLAHELGHIRLGHHRRLGLAAALGIIAGASLVLVAGFAASVAAGVVLSLLVARFVSRRCEFEADAWAVRLTGDAEALVTALVRIGRLNHVPLHWGRAAESGLTHPSTLRRCEALARAAGIGAERLRELLDRTDPPREVDAVPAPASPGGKLFSSAFKRRHSGGLSWLLLALALAMAATGVNLARWLELPRLLAPLAGALLAFGAMLAATDLLAARAIADLRRRLAAHLAAGGEARYVGLAPGESPRVYEGFFDWDLGFVTLAPDALEYRGEEAEFRLPREAILDVRRAAGPPGWLPAPRVAIEWQDPVSQETGVVHLRPAHATRLDALPRETAALLDAIARWRAAGPAAGATRTQPPPREEDVTGTPLSRVAHPSTLVPAAVLAAIGSLLLARATGQPLWPFAGPGAFEAWLGTMGALVLARVPWWRHREARREAREETRRAA